jgi:hypothetical protein
LGITCSKESFQGQLEAFGVEECASKSIECSQGIRESSICPIELIKALIIQQFDGGHFKKANEWLRERYGEDGEIDWNLNVDPAVAGV